MVNHFTITIHDDNGVKQFKLHQFVKKAIVYAVVFVGLILLIGTGTILYLNNMVDEIEKNISEVQAAYDKLQTKNQNLNQDIKENQIVLFTKKEEINELSESLKQIETMMGLVPDDNVTIEERLNNTKMTSEHRGTLLQLIPSGSPVEYKGITSKFGYRIHPVKKTKELHKGSDLKAAMNTPVYATADGIVEWAGFHKNSGFGKLVIVTHSFGFKSSFGHLNKIVVKSNKFVKKGDLIGYTGNTGMSSGPHLHYEIRHLHRALNPYWFIKWNVENYNTIFEKEKKVPWQSLITATQHIRVEKPTQTLPLSLREVPSKGR